MTGALGTLAVHDRSDLLSPILVKELRQGIRGTVFTGAFLLLHVLMLAAVGVSLTLLTQGVPRSPADALFWFLISLPILVVLPLSGGASLSGERTGHTLEPLLLTRLSARQIVFGKWASVVLLSALLMSSVLPYVVLRYFLGGVNLLYELLGLLDLWLCCLVLSAVALGLASLRASPLFRWALVIGLGGFLVGQLQPVLQMAVGRMGGWDPSLVALALGLVAVILVLFLEAGSLQVAPPAEARSGRVRGLALLALLLGALASRRGAMGTAQRVADVILVAWALVVAACVAIGSLCEDVKDIPGLYAPSFRGGRLRPGHALFIPGWPSGFAFTLVLITGAAFILWPFVVFSGQGLLFSAALAGTFLLPAAILRVLLRSRLKTFPGYVALQVVFAAPAIVYGLGGLTDDSWLQAAGATGTVMSPLSALILMDESPRAALFVIPAITALSVAGLAWEARRAYVSLKERVRQAASRPGPAEPASLG